MCITLSLYVQHTAYLMLVNYSLVHNCVLLGNTSFLYLNTLQNNTLLPCILIQRCHYYKVLLHYYITVPIFLSILHCHIFTARVQILFAPFRANFVSRYYRHIATFITPAHAVYLILRGTLELRFVL